MVQDGEHHRLEADVGAGDLFGECLVLQVALLEDGDEQVDLRREVVEQALAGDAGLGGDHVDRGAPVATRGEGVLRRVDETLAGRAALGRGVGGRAGHVEGRTVAVVSGSWEALWEGNVRTSVGWFAERPTGR